MGDLVGVIPSDADAVDVGGIADYYARHSPPTQPHSSAEA
jgi:hypothetical protein